MTTQGCKACPSDHVIAPLRNTAIILFTAVFLLGWIWFSWTPLFPSVTEYLSFIGNFGSSNLKWQKFVHKVYEQLVVIKKFADKAKLPQYFKIFVVFFQITSSFLSFQVNWPTTLLDAMVWLKATINFSILSLPGVSCLWKTVSYRGKLLVYTIAPLGLLACLAIPSCVAMAMICYSAEKASKDALRKRLDATLDRFWIGIMFTAFMLYPLLSLSTLEPFNCQPAGLGLLAADYREPCPTPTSFERLWAIIFILVYPVGIPIGSIMVLRSMGVHDIARKKIEGAIVSAMINLFIKRTTSVESQTIAKIIGPVGFDKAEFKKRVHTLYSLIWPSPCPDSSMYTNTSLLNIVFKRIKIKVLKASNLPKMDQFGSIDPFCVLSLAGRKEKTTTIKNCQNPSWSKEEFLFEIETNLMMRDELLNVTVEVFDWDHFGSNRLAGQALINGANIKRIIEAGSGCAESFTLDVDVLPSTRIFETTAFDSCQLCCTSPDASDTDKGESTGDKKFQLTIRIECMEPLIAGSEISKLKEFSAMYNADGVCIVLIETMIGVTVKIDNLLILLSLLLSCLAF